jgi:hypothetical protein
MRLPEFQAQGVIHDLGEGDAPRRPRYVLPDYALALQRGSAHLGLDAPCDLDEALTYLLAMYISIPSTTGYPAYLGDLDTLLDPFVDDLSDAEIDARLRRFWQILDQAMPDSTVHANLVGRWADRPLALRVDRELRQSCEPDLAG